MPLNLQRSDSSSAFSGAFDAFVEVNMSGLDHDKPAGKSPVGGEEAGVPVERASSLGVPPGIASGSSGSTSTNAVRSLRFARRTLITSCPRCERIWHSPSPKKQRPESPFERSLESREHKPARSKAGFAIFQDTSTVVTSGATLRRQSPPAPTAQANESGSQSSGPEGPQRLEREHRLGSTSTEDRAAVQRVELLSTLDE